MNPWFASILLFIFGFFSVESRAIEDHMAEIERNIAQIDTLFLSNTEALDHQEVLEISRKVIKGRDFYNNDTLAKAFSLLADSAINKGDLANAMQFASDGESLMGVSPSLRLPLLLKVVSGYYLKGQYHHAKSQAEQAVTLAKEINKPKYLILALGYRSMTNALIAEHQLALLDLEQVQQLLVENKEFTDHLALLEVLASAHFYLGSYQTALSLYNKTKKIRFDRNNTYNIEQTYYHIARCFLKLGQLDDAFHAFTAALDYAEEKAAPIHIAYAQLGLGQVLYQQQKFARAVQLLEQSERNFHGQNLSQPYLTTLLNLAKAYKAQDKLSISHQYLLQAETLVENTELTQEQIEYFLLLSEMYFENQEYKKASQAQSHYISLYKEFDHSHQHLMSEYDSDMIAAEKAQAISLSISEEAELRNQFERRFLRQNNLLIILSTSLVIMLLILLYFAYKMRALRLNQQYDEIEKPLDFIASPSQTKSFYQQHYKMARKFEYPLAVGYFSIDNWQELEFQFSKKVIEEVARTIATLVNEHHGEFDQVGLINEGEYLFLSPHQEPEQLKKLFEQLTNSIKVQFFANLGEFSLKVSYDCQSPSVQDIDPYIFLSRLSESTRAEYSSYKT